MKTKMNTFKNLTLHQQTMERLSELIYAHLDGLENKSMGDAEVDELFLFASELRSRAQHIKAGYDWPEELPSIEVKESTDWLEE